MAEKRRPRINGHFRWSDQQAKDLVTIVLENVKSNPEQFEKPTAQKFYERIAENAPNLHRIKWDIMRTKMRHLKNSFLNALKWKSQEGKGLIEQGNVEAVEEYIKKTCPFYDELYAIFVQRVNIEPPVIYQLTSKPEALLETWEVKEEVPLNIDCETSSTFSLENPLASPSITLSIKLSENQDDSSVVPTPPTLLEENDDSTSCTFAANPCIQKQTTTTPKINLKRTHSSSAFALLLEIQKKRLELEVQKLEFEKEKEANKVKFQKLQLEKEERIEMAKIRLEHERLKSSNK